MAGARVFLVSMNQGWALWLKEIVSVSSSCRALQHQRQPVSHKPMDQSIVPLSRTLVHERSVWAAGKSSTRNYFCPRPRLNRSLCLSLFLGSTLGRESSNLSCTTCDPAQSPREEREDGKRDCFHPHRLAGQEEGPACMACGWQPSLKERTSRSVFFPVLT